VRHLPGPFPATAEAACRLKTVMVKGGSHNRVPAGGLREGPLEEEALGNFTQLGVPTEPKDPMSTALALVHPTTKVFDNSPGTACCVTPEIDCTLSSREWQPYLL